jgi:predicted anti-sigma-YlaC factor YlaD
MTKTDCKTCQTYLPDLLDGAVMPDGVSAHVAECSACRTELRELQATWALLDEWTAPEPSAFFDSRLHARLREAQAAPPEGLWERLTSFLRFSTGRELRPILAGVLTVLMILGGGTASWFFHQGAGSSASSPTVNDLNIYDKNAQALQQMDLLDDAGGDNGGTPQT